MTKSRIARCSEEAKQKLRDVQEILAESIFGPANHYFMRRAYPAVTDRYEEILEKYPDFSGTDRVLYLMAETYRKSNKPEEGASITPELSATIRFEPRG